MMDPQTHELHTSLLTVRTTSQCKEIQAKLEYYRLVEKKQRKAECFDLLSPF